MLAGLVASDNDAWRDFTGRFRQPIVRFARSLGLSGAAAEDVAQETLIAFADQVRRGRYDRARGRLSRWLFGIAYRQALNERRAGARRAARTAPADSHLVDSLPDEQSATRTWDRLWERSVLEQCLQQVRGEVDPDTFRAFELVIRDEKSPADAASILGRPVKLVYNAKHRVLKRIRELRAELEELI
ncbi:MAG: RNA polymerase sigma factor [Phycisphaeraceae bacterium]|nr:RNA polymerase sigma factor [Phycisphaeraceae bacterium]